MGPTKVQSVGSSGRITPEMIPSALPTEPQERVRTCLRLLVNPELRLLSLTGMPGVGKSWLARQVVSAAQTLPQRVYTVTLSELDSWLLLFPHLAEQLGVTSDPPTLWGFKEAVTERLKGESALLVLDGFETVMPAASALAEMLRACPELSLLVTSRTPLGLEEESAYSVPPLSSPDPNDIASSERSSGVLLMYEHAHQLALEETVSLSKVQVAKLCGLLGGLPIALLGAAQQLPQRSASDLLADLSDPAYLKTWDLRSVSEHTNLFELLEPYYEQLPSDVQRLLASASMFGEPFNLASLNVVLSSAYAGAGATAEQVNALKLQGTLTSAFLEEKRFILNPLIRDFLKLELDGADDYAALVEAYGRYAAHASADETASAKSTEVTYSRQMSISDEYSNLSTSDDVDSSDSVFQDEEACDLFTEELTERELDVLELVVKGLSNREVASRLDISHRTVSTHLSNIYGKLGVRTRTAAALRARQLELIPDL